MDRNKLAVSKKNGQYKIASTEVKSVICYKLRFYPSQVQPMT